MWNYNWMEWGLNPRTGQSMNLIQTPYGLLPANVFMQVPKELFFMNSSEYCCKGRGQANYQQAMYDNSTSYYQAIANLNPVCCTNIPKTNITPGGC